LPVRGPKSRQAVKDAKQSVRPAASTRAARGSGSPLADQPLPAPTAPPPGPAVTPKSRRQAADTSSDTAAALVATASGDGVQHPGKAPVNELLPFLDFVGRHPVGTACTVVVESYASHGAYARAGDVLVYVPLRLMGDPPPRSARAALKIGEAVAVVIVGYVPERRSIDAALVSAGDAAARAQAAPPETPAAEAQPATKRRTRAKQAAEVVSDAAPPVEVAAEPAPKRRRSTSRAKAEPQVEQPAPEVATAAPAAKRTRRKAEPTPADVVAEPAAAPKPTRKRTAKQAEPVAEPPAKPVARGARKKQSAPAVQAEQPPKPPRKRSARPQPEKAGA
jgi:hypothetical protein